MMTSMSRRRDAARARQGLSPRIEILESRQLLSAAVTSALDTAGLAPRSAADAAVQQPSVRATNPVGGSTGFDVNGFVVAYVNLPNVAGVTDDPTALATNVRLYRAGDPTRQPISSRVNTTGGGDAIILTPLEPLAGNTEYQFEVSAGLTDQTGATFVPFTMKFTTGDVDQGGPDPNVVFSKVSLPTASGRRFTGITIGPDHRLYAGTMDGEIVRFDINNDGTVGAPTVINTVIKGNNNAKRIITGVRFDPASTATNLILWVTHGDGAEVDAPDFSGKLSRLTGPALATYEDYITHL